MCLLSFLLCLLRLLRHSYFALVFIPYAAFVLILGGLQRNSLELDHYSTIQNIFNVTKEDLVLACGGGTFHVGLAVAYALRVVAPGRESERGEWREQKR